MYKNKIKKAARKVKKDLKGKVNIISLIEYLKKFGYSTVFYNTSEGDEILKAYELKDIDEKGFAYCGTTKAVFVNAELSVSDRVYTLLHELGHIVFNHVDNLEHLDKDLLEAEAEAFMYEVVTHNNILCIS